MSSERTRLHSRLKQGPSLAEKETQLRNTRAEVLPRSQQHLICHIILSMKHVTECEIGNVVSGVAFRRRTIESCCGYSEGQKLRVARGPAGAHPGTAGDPPAERDERGVEQLIAKRQKNGPKHAAGYSNHERTVATESEGETPTPTSNPIPIVQLL